MDNLRRRLLGSKSEALAAKSEFESKYTSHRDDLAVGLGVNARGDDWTLMVFADTKAAAKSLPDHVGNFAVEVQITGTVKAL